MVERTATTESGWQALEQGDWKRARKLFADAGESAEALEGLGLAAWWLDEEAALDARERAYRLYREQGDPRGAGRVATWLAWDYSTFRGERAIANGWLQRARRLLDDLEPCAEQGWLALREASMVLGDDPERARALATGAVELGRTLRDFDLEMTAFALDGLVRVSQGDVAAGMTQLDEATAAAVGGEFRDRNAIGLSCCYLIFACERTQDFERAGQWCERLAQLPVAQGNRALSAVCRAHYGSVLALRGSWAAAERELVGATDTLAVTRPGDAGDGLARLGELRRRQGRLHEAEALFRKAEPHPLARLGEAALALERGRPLEAAEAAAAVADRYGGRLRLERAAALELLARANAALGEVDRAASYADDLGELALVARSEPLQASAAFARAAIALADGDVDGARRHCTTAVDLYTQNHLPFEAAQARLELAATLGLLGREEAAAAETERAREALATLGVTRRRGDGSLTTRELEVLRLVAEGLSDGEIAERLVLSEHTVHRHIANVRTKLGVGSRAAAAAKAARSGLL